MAKTRGLAPNVIASLRRIPSCTRRLQANDILSRAEYNDTRYYLALSVHLDAQAAKRMAWCLRCQHDLRHIIRTGDIPHWYNSDNICVKHPLDY